MPVTAEVGRVGGDDHDVARPGLDVVVAAGAEVALRRLVGLDAPDLYFGLRPSPHATSASVRTIAAATMT